jgi:hypothetical protein
VAVALAGALVDLVAGAVAGSALRVEGLRRRLRVGRVQVGFGAEELDLVGGGLGGCACGGP